MGLHEGFRIGEYGVFPLEGRITGPGGSLRVEPKAMAVLVELARHAPEVRSRAQIEQVVWPRGFVSDDALTRCIGQLRRALGDDSKSPTLLETIPKRGYRLRAAVCSRGSTSRAVAKTESLLVLPFRHLSNSTETFIADGLTELLILRLCSVHGLRILSRTTAMEFASTTVGLADIAARSGADWVVEGAVLQFGDQVQVVAQLVDARTDAHVWSGNHTRGLQDLLAVQNDIAESVAAAISVQLARDGGPAWRAPVLAPPVMRNYLRARHLMSRRTVPALREALAALEAAIAESAEFAPAWASRAECELLLMHYGAAPTEALLGPCESHLERALALDPNLGIALSARAGLRFFFALDFDGAERDVQRALALLPSWGTAMVLLASLSAVRHRFAEASAWIGQALLVDPLDVGTNMNLGDHMILQRRWSDAVGALRRALELAPGHRPSQFRLAWALALGSRGDAARETLAACRVDGSTDAAWLEYAALVEGACGDARTAAMHDDALVRLGASQRVSAWSIARSAAAAGRREAALAALNAAVRERSSSLPFLRLTPAFEILHGEARFEALCRSLGLDLRNDAADARIAPKAFGARPPNGIDQRV